MFRVVLAGAPAFVFTWLSGLLVRLPTGSVVHRIGRAGVLVLGLTVFGVTTAEHLLRNAGLESDRLVRYALAASFLHVPYRIFFAAVLTQALSL
jgi:hypothetical protein